MAVLLGGIGASRKTESADAGAEIRKVLKIAFPGIKFSVRKRSGGNSITIEWENGPTVKQVQSYTNDFKMGSFDGMTDMYSYDNKNKNIPQVKYIFYNRYMSKKLAEFLRSEITKGWNFDNMKDWEKEIAIEREMYKDFNSTSLPAGLSGIKKHNIGRVKL